MAGNNQSVQITLGFRADTSGAKQAIQQLNAQLNQIMSMNTEQLGINRELAEAADAAKVLQQNLQSALNVKTGQINMTQFATNLRNAGTSVTQLGQKLMNAGSTGTAAFAQLGRSIAAMDVPLKQTNATLSNFMTTIKNTAKWEFSSKLIHGIESAFSSAINYAKDLNKALTDIRVVSGASLEDMAKFAQQANAAAKVLGTTTKEYAEAAKIYYQQGDSAELAAKKAEITLKATNAAFKATAQEMSEMLTSTWNGYKVGADELEKYVDIVANLGANTASSMEEIMTSLQKVAATANTVGVSMDQMSAMIATVSSTTRQSAEIVGTAMNTMLSRFASLKLGETLDDGVTLTKYTNALASIGVNVLDANGELRSMGNIINDIMEKWQTLSTSQKAALAQTVGSVRQYTNIMALFNNQEAYQRNMGLAQNSSGALQKMQDIRMQGWEGASKRLKASIEGIYQSLIDDQGFIAFTNSITKVVEQVENLIKTFGGMQGIIQQLGAIALQVFSNNIGAGVASLTNKITTFANSFKNLKALNIDKDLSQFTRWEKTKNFVAAFGMNTDERVYRQQAQEAYDQMRGARDVGDAGLQAQINASQTLIEKKLELQAAESTMTQSQKANAQAALATLTAQANEIDQVAQSYKEANRELQQQQNNLNSIRNLQESAANATDKRIQAAAAMNDPAQLRQAYNDSVVSYLRDGKSQKLNANGLFQALDPGKVQQAGNGVQVLVQRMADLNQASSVFNNASGMISSALSRIGTQDATQASASIEKLTTDLERQKAVLTQAGADTTRYDAAINSLKTAQASGDVNQMTTALQGAELEMDRMAQSATVGASTALGVLSGRLGMSQDQLIAVANAVGITTDQLIRLSIATGNFNANADSFSVKMGNVQKVVSGFTRAIGAMGGAFTSAYNMMANWDDANLTSKVTSVTSTITQGINSIMSGAMAGASVGGGWGALAGGIIGLGTTVAGLIMGKNEAEEKARKKEINEQYKRNEKAGEATGKEISSAQSLISTYNTLYETYLKTGEGQEELLQTALEIASAWDLQGAAVLALSGNFELFNQKVRESLNYSELLSKAQQNAATAAEGMRAAIAEANKQESATPKVDKYSPITLNDLDALAAIRTNLSMSQEDWLSLPMTDPGVKQFIYGLAQLPGYPSQYHSGWDNSSGEKSESPVTMAGMVVQSFLGNDYTPSTDSIKKRLGVNDIDPNTYGIGQLLFGENDSGRAWYHWTAERGPVAALDEIYEEFAPELEKLTLGTFLKGSTYKYSHSLLGSAFYTEDGWRDHQMGLEEDNAWMVPYMPTSWFNQETEYSPHYAQIHGWFGENSKYGHLITEGGGLQLSLDNVYQAAEDLELITEWVAEIDAMLPTVDSGSKEYKLLSNLRSGLIDLQEYEIDGETPVSDWIKAAKERQDELNEVLRLQASVSSMFGRNEENTTFAQYVQYVGDLETLVDQQYKTMEGMEDFADMDLEDIKKDEKLWTKYQRARQQIIDGIINDTTAFDTYGTMLSTINNTFTSQDQRDQVLKLIDKEHITEISGKTLAALQYLLDHDIALFDEASGEVTDIVKQILASNGTYDTSFTSTKYSSAKSSLKKTMGQEDLETIRSSLFKTERDATGKWVTKADDGTTWEQFIAKDYKAREAWIDSMIDGAVAKDKERFEAIKEQSQKTADAWRATMESQFKDGVGAETLKYLDDNYDKLTESYNRYQYAMSQYFEVSANGFKLKALKDGEQYADWIVEAFGADAVQAGFEITDEQYATAFGAFLKTEVDKDGNPLYDPTMIDNLTRTEGGYQKLIAAYATWMSYNADTRTAQDFIEILEGMGTAADDASTKISRLSSAMSSIPTASDEFGKLLASINEYEDSKGHWEIPEIIPDDVSPEDAAHWVKDGKKYTGKDLYTLYSANDKTGWYDLLIGAAEHELTKIEDTESDEYAMKQFEIEQMRHTRDQYKQNQELELQSDKVSQYTSQVSTLQTAYKELAENGEISGKTANLLKKLGIDADGLHTLKQVNKAMEDARKNLKQTMTDIKNSTNSSVSKFFTDEAASLTWEQFKDKNKEGLAEVSNLDDYEAQFNAWKEAYWAWAQGLDGWEDTLDQIVANRQSKALKQFKAKTDEMQKQVDKMKEASELLSNAVGTGELSAGDKAKIRASGLGVDPDAFERAATAEERMAIAAKAYSRYTTKAYELMERQNTQYEEILNGKNGLAPILDREKMISGFESTKFNSVNDFLKATGLDKMSDASQQVIRDAWSALSLDGKTGYEAANALAEYIQNLKTTNSDAYKEIEAAGIDAMKAIYKSQAEESQAAAEAEIERWKQTFQAIANIRTAILGGNTNNLSSEDWMRGFLASDYATPEEYQAALQSGNVEAFKLPEFNEESYLATLGFSLDMLGMDATGKSRYSNVSGKGLLQREEQRLRDEGLLDESLIPGQARANVEQALTTLLQQDARFGATANQIPGLVKSFLDNGNTFSINGVDVFSEVSRMLAGEKYDAETRQVNIQSQKEAKTVRDRDYAAQENAIAQADRTIADLTEMKNAAYQLAEDMGAKTVSETMKSFKLSNDDLLGKINQVMQSNYTSLEEIPAQVLRDFADNMQTELEAPTQDKIDAVKQQMAIETAYLQSLKDTGASQTDIDAQTEKIAKLAETYDDLVDAQSKASDQSFQEYLNSLANEANITAKQLQDYTAELIKSGEISASLSEREQVKYAKGLYRQSQGLTTAKNNLKAYRKELKESAGDIDRHNKAIGNMRSMYADIFDLDSNQAQKLSQPFLESAENAELLEKALKGDQKAYNALKAAAAKDLVVNVNTNMAQDSLNALIDTIANYDFGDIEIGTSLDTAPFYSALQAMQIGSQDAADAISAALSSIGVDAQLVPHTVTLGEGQAQIDASGALTIPKISPDGKTITYTTVAASGGYSLSADGGTATYWTIEGAKYNGRGVTRGGGGGKSGGGGGGGKKKHEQKDKQPERYHQITRQLKDQSSLLAQNDKLKQRKYGNSYIEALEQENKLITKQIELNKKKLAEAQKYIETDRAELASYGATFDAEGNVNYLAYQKMWDDWLKAQGEIEMDDEQWKKVQEKYEKAMQALKNYEEAQDVIREQEEAILDAQNKIYENNLRKITYKLEVRLELNDNDLKRLEYFIKKYANAYNSLEFATDSYEAMQKQMEKYQDNLRGCGEAKAELDRAYAAGEIDQAKYVEGLKQVNSDLLENLTNIDELDKTMREWYGETLKSAREELTRLTDVMDHENKVFSNYLEILKLTGNEQDYEKLAAVYAAQITASEAKTAMLQQHLESLNEEKAKLEKALELNPDDTYAKQQLQDLMEEIQQTEQDVQTSAIETLKAIKDEWANTVDDITRQNKKAVSTTGEDLDWVKQKWQWWNDEQEFYVDTVTELYEVNKLNRKIEEQLAKTRDKTNQRELLQLQEEINLKSRSGQLTKYELEMMDLQYELLLKRQALEEAQNAKSTVTLTRDENGNYIYQYTADQDEISKKAQEYEDVLYQINQKADEEYKRLGNKLLSLEEEFANALDENMRNLNISEEERQKRYEEIMNHYTPLIQATADKMGVVEQNLLTNQSVWTQKYGLDIERNAGVTNDQVTKIMTGMTQNVGTFLTTLETNYESRYKPALEAMQTKMAAVTKLINADWDSMKTRMGEVGDKAIDTKGKAKELDDTMKDSLKGIRDATSAWKSQYEQLKLDIKAYETLNSQINETIRKLSQLKGSTPTSTPTASVTVTTTGGPGSGGSGGSSGSGGSGGTGGTGGPGGGGTLSIKYKVACTTGPHKGQAVGGSPTGPSSLAVGETGTVSHNPSTGYVKGGWSISDTSKCSISGGTIKALAAGSVTITMNYWDRTDQGGTTSNTTTPSVTSNTRTSPTASVPRAAKGGLMDYTGPAWVDGTFTKPEYILNADQTQEMFKLLNDHTINNLVVTMRDATVAMLAGMRGNLTSYGGSTTYGSSMMQEVNIYAEFPSATDRNEIREALNGLVARASQNAVTFIK